MRALAGAMGNIEEPFVGIWLQLNSYGGRMGMLSEFELWNEKGSSPMVENSAQLGAWKARMKSWVWSPATLISGVMP